MSWLALGIGWLPSLGTAYAAVTGAKQLVRNDIGQLELAYSLNVTVANLGKALLVAAAVMVVFRYLRPSALVNPAPLWAMALIGTSMAANIYHGGPKFLNELLILLLLLGSAILAPKGKPFALGLGIFGVSVGVVSALVSAISFPTTVAPCERKCGILGVLYFGLFNNENQLGVILVCCLPFVWLAFEHRRGMLLSLYLVALVASTGNRASTAVAVGVLVVLMVVRPSYEGDGAKGRRGPLLGMVVAISAAASVAVPLISDDPLSFTGRGRLWTVARNSWEQNLFFGTGFNSWRRMQIGTSLDFVGDYSPHNLWLDLAVAAGFMGVALFAVMVVTLWIMRAPGGGYVLGVVLVTVLTLGTLEQPLSFFEISSFTFVLFGLLLAVPQRTVPRQSRRVSRASRVAAGPLGSQ